MSDWWGLRGARVLVAGGGGLGAACARGLAGAGAEVLVADVDEERLAGLGPDLATCRADLRTTEGCEAAVATAVERWGGLDVLVHAIGTNHRVPVLEVTDEAWERILEINLGSAFRLGRAAGRVMTAQGRGRQVFLSSVSGVRAHPDHGPYAASKGGMDQLVRVMAREWAPHGVTVNAVAPGYTETDLTSEHLARPGVRDHYTGMVPAGRLGGVDDVVGPVLFLASEPARFVTGQVLLVDGGRTLV